MYKNHCKSYWINNLVWDVQDRNLQEIRNRVMQRIVGIVTSALPMRFTTYINSPLCYHYSNVIHCTYE